MEVHILMHHAWRLCLYFPGGRHRVLLCMEVLCLVQVEDSGPILFSLHCLFVRSPLPHGQSSLPLLFLRSHLGIQ